MVAIEPPTSAVVIFGDENDEIVKLLNTTASSFLSLETKYYSASVQIIKSDSASTDLPINGVIFNNSFQQAQEISENYEPFRESDVRLFCTKIDPTKEMHNWAIANQVEIIDIEEEPERVLQALESSIWPGATMKSGNPYIASGRPIESASDLDSSAQNEQNRMSEKIKICVVGDRNAGKTIFCNLIAGQFSDAAQLLEHRRPTASLRVLEFEHEIDSKTSIDVELWDCSGDPEQEKIWPSFRHSCGGVIIFSRDTSIESFVDYFVESGAVQPEQSLLWINKEGGPKLTNTVVPDIHQLDVLSDIESSKSKFAKFLRKCVKVESEVQDRDERRIAA